MSCIIFGYRRFYAIICKITHFFYPKRKNPPLFAHSALHSTLHKAKSVPCTTLPTCAASASPPAAETMTGGEHFRHPGRRWQLCETPYLATRGRGDMRGVPNRSTSIAPRRWCGAVLPPWFYVYHFVCQRCKT